MIEIEDQTFSKARVEANYSDVTARRCAFNQCNLPNRSTPGSWNRISNVHLSDVSHWNCSINGSVFEDVSLHNLKRTGDAPLFLWGCVFRRVKLSGRLSGIKINRAIGAGPAFHAVQPAWDSAASKFYADVDWALDISEAQFPGGVTFEAIPGHLIRRDPGRQVLVTRKALSAANIDSLDFDKTAINIALSWFLRGSMFDSVVVAARSDSKWAKRDGAVLNMLRSEGLAEPD
jgi:uncharacterized protein YjbI with pentapeptide repeats